MVIRENIFSVSGFMDEEKIGFIFFMEHQPIILGVIAEPMPEDLVGALRLVQGQVKERLAVVRPLHTGMIIDTTEGIGNCLRKELPCDQILDINRIDFAALCI